MVIVYQNRALDWTWIVPRGGDKDPLSKNQCNDNVTQKASKLQFDNHLSSGNGQKSQT